MSTIRDLIEEPAFTEQVAGLGDTKRLDEALSALSWALSSNATCYPVMPSFKRLRVAKTVARGDVPALRVLFTIENDADKCAVHLHWIEPYEEETAGD
ncbi:MAG: hypothetical protein KKD44_27620 [Proteobacteria bacterium]|nr:hypothetical protein [Pseudomonadota bacterium]